MKPNDNLSGFATFFQEDGQYYFQFNDEQGLPVLYSHGYQSEKSRDKGIKTVIRNARKPGHYEQKQSAQGHYFILKSGNHQEIARSRLFDQAAEMEARQQLLLNIPKNVPVFERQKGKQFETTSVEKLPGTENPQKKAIENVAPGKEPGQLLRYKFSVIYYPDAGKWSVKTDFPESSPKIKPTDEQQIGALLQPYLPLQPSTQEPAKRSRKIAQSPQPIPERSEDAIREELELKFFNFGGQEIKVAASPQQLVKIEVLSKVGKPYAQDMLFDAQLEAKALQSKEEAFVLGTIHNQAPQSGRIFIPIENTPVLKSGLYRFTATVHPHTADEEWQDFTGSRLLILN